MNERATALHRVRLETRKSLGEMAGHLGARVLESGDRQRRELIDRHSADQTEIVVSRDTALGQIEARLGADAGIRSIADHVTEAPERVGRMPFGAGEHGGERLLVSVDVTQDGDTRGQLLGRDGQGPSYDRRVVRLRFPTRRGRRAALLAAAGLALGGAIVGVLRWQLWSEPVAAVDTPPVDAFFDPAELVRNRDYRRGLWSMALVAIPIAPLAAWGVAATVRRWAPRLDRITRGHALAVGAGVGAGLAVAIAVAELPVRVARYLWGRDFGVITQEPAAWVLDVAKGIGLEAILLGLVGVGLAAMMWWLPRAWPIGLAALLAAGVFVGSYAGPVLFEPIFQSTATLEDDELRQDVLDLAGEAGVSVDDVLVNDASARTTASNAYVSGLGGTKRIVLFDTLIRDAPPGEVRAVVAHELAHVSRGHVLKGTTWAAALAVPAALLIAALVGWRTGFSPPSRDRAGRVLLAGRLAWAGVGATLVLVALIPIGNWISRAYENEADAIALELTGDPAAQIALHQGLIERSLGVPDPPGPLQGLLGSHPTPIERIGRASSQIDGRE